MGKFKKILCPISKNKDRIIIIQATFLNNIRAIDQKNLSCSLRILDYQLSRVNSTNAIHLEKVVRDPNLNMNHFPVIIKAMDLCSRRNHTQVALMKI